MWSETNCPTAWKVRAGGGDEPIRPELVKLNLDNKITHVGYSVWVSDQEISFFDDKGAVRQYFDDHSGLKSLPRKDKAISSICMFRFDLEIGDVVVMPLDNYGSDDQWVAIGIVTGPVVAIDQPERNLWGRSAEWISENVKRPINGTDLANSIKSRGTISRSHAINATERLLCLAFDGYDPGHEDHWSSDQKRRIEELLTKAESIAERAALNGDQAGVIRNKDGKVIEGANRQVQVNRYENNKRARDLCIEEHGDICKVCEINFGEAYGDFANGFIHVHHITPMSIAAREGEYELDPVEDLVPVCPNCHAMLHKHSDDPCTWEKLRDLWKARRSLSK